MINYVLIPTLSLLILLFFIIFQKKEKPMFDTCLLYWIAFIFLHLLALLISFHEDYNKDLTHIVASLSIVHGPFLYLYTNILTKKIVVFKPILLFHFALAVTCLLLIVVIDDYLTLYYIDCSVSITSLSVYAVLSLKRMREYQKDIGDLYSNIDHINYDWLKYLIIGVLSILFLALASYITYYWIGITPPFTFAFLVIMLPFVGFLCYKNIIARIVYNEDYQATSQQTSDASYRSSKLASEDAQKLAQLIEQHIREDRAYLKMDLKLSDIATALDVYPHHITETLNTVFKRNFNDFINSYRVEEAKQQLLEMNKNNLTIVGVAYDCGFNSKSSFYRIFKQSTGFTPTEYLNQQKD